MITPIISGRAQCCHRAANGISGDMPGVDERLLMNTTVNKFNIDHCLPKVEQCELSYK